LNNNSVNYDIPFIFIVNFILFLKLVISLSSSTPYQNHKIFKLNI